MGKAISPSHLSGGAETEMKRQRKTVKAKETSPRVELLANTSPEWLKKKKAHLHAEREIKVKTKEEKRSVSSCFINKLQGEY